MSKELDGMAPVQPDPSILTLASVGAATRIPTTLPAPERCSDLPRMSWLCSIDDSGAALVIGDDAEEIPTGVFEGVWDGPFDRREPQRAEHLFGSGVVGNSGELLILTPKHTLEGVFVLEHKRTRRLYFSNSLAYVCC